MKTLCPHCGEFIEVSGLGRHKIDMPVKNICDAISRYKAIAGAARALGVSRVCV